MSQTNKKQLQLKNLWQELANDTGHSKIEARRKGKITNLGLVNQYKNHSFIPNKWFDWESKADAPVMIIGQDWGPYIELKKLIDRYISLKDDEGFDYQNFLFDTFSSRTEKFILKAIQETYPKKDKSIIEISDLLFFTVAVLFTRTGIHFRGNHNFDPKRSSEHSYPFLAKQIDIVNPKVIVPLGGLALTQVERYIGFTLPGNSLSDKINKLEGGILQTDDKIIVPNYHPAAHVPPHEMMERWKLIWNKIA